MNTCRRSDPSGVPQAAIQDPALLNALINDQNGGADCILSKSADETNLGEMADEPGACGLMQGEVWMGWSSTGGRVKSFSQGAVTHGTSTH